MNKKFIFSPKFIVERDAMEHLPKLWTLTLLPESFFKETFLLANNLSPYHASVLTFLKRFYALVKMA